MFICVCHFQICQQFLRPAMSSQTVSQGDALAAGALTLQPTSVQDCKNPTVSSRALNKGAALLGTDPCIHSALLAGHGMMPPETFGAGLLSPGVCACWCWLQRLRNQSEWQEGHRWQPGTFPSMEYKGLARPRQGLAGSFPSAWFFSGWKI